MALLLTARLAKEASSALYSAVQGFAFVHNGDQFHCNLGEGGDFFRQAYAHVRKHGNDLVRQTITYVEDLKVYREDRDEILGYVVDARDCIDFDNPEADFVEPIPRHSRDNVRIKESVTLQLTEKPKGVIAYVGEELIFQREFIELIRGDEIVAMDYVALLGRPLGDWHRLLVRATHSAVDRCSTTSGSCAYCGTPCTWPTRLWFANRNESIARPMFNDFGLGHFSVRDVLIVPQATRAALVGKTKRLQCKGVIFNPLYSKDTSRYKVVKLINDLTSHLADATPR